MQFLPFHEVKLHRDVLIVDSYFRGRTMFSHWRGAPKLPQLHDDTSTGIVLNALKAQHPACDFPFVSNNHFDIDGFLGIWALMNPQLAMEHESLLREAALIGDFREWDPHKANADLALKLCCWINHREQTLFYRPFGEKVEAKACIEKYQYFLPLLQDFLNNPECFSTEYETEYQKVKEGAYQIKQAGSIERLEGIQLQIVKAPEPLHYYALFQGSERMDIVLSMYANNRYELEYKYTSWVDTESRLIYPRLDFGPLAEKLNVLETGPYAWEYDGIMDTGPLLRLQKSELSKADRYAHPFERNMYSSNISPPQLIKIVKEHYLENLKDKPARSQWTWKEMQAMAR